MREEEQRAQDVLACVSDAIVVHDESSLREVHREEVPHLKRYLKRNKDVRFKKN